MPQQRFVRVVVALSTLLSVPVVTVGATPTTGSGSASKSDRGATTSQHYSQGNHPQSSTHLPASKQPAAPANPAISPNISITPGRQGAIVPWHGTATRTVQITNDTPNPYSYRVQELPPPTPRASAPAGNNILVLNTTSIGNSVVRALNDLGQGFDEMDTEDWTGINFANYTTVIATMDGGLVEQSSIQTVRQSVIDAGKNLIFLGGTCYYNFADGVNQYLLANDLNNYCWTISTSPQWTLIDPNHPLAKNLPSQYDYLDSQAGFYQIRPTDTDAHYIAHNGDGYYNYLTKGIGAGTFTWYTSSVYDGYWSYDSDYAVLKQIISNSLTGGGGDITWLTENPTSGTVPGNSTQNIGLLFDANAVNQPGIYTGTLRILATTPGQPNLQVLVGMKVNPSATMGLLQGRVTSDRPGGPVAGAIITIDNGNPIQQVKTKADGSYSVYLERGIYTVHASADGYLSSTATVTIPVHRLVTQNFQILLNQPLMSVSPTSMQASLQQGQSSNQTLTISNGGAGELNWQIAESASAEGSPRQVPVSAGSQAPKNTAAGRQPGRTHPAGAVSIQPRSSQPSTSLEVLLLNADDDSDGDSPIRDFLAAFGDMNLTLYDARNATPSLSELQAYDVVVTWSDYPYADPVGMGNVLADYVDAGGKVIDMMFAVGVSPWSMQGRFHDEGYTAIQGDYPAYTRSCLGTYDATDPIMEGVTELCDDYRAGSTYLSANATGVAYYQDGEVMVAKKDDMPVVTISSYPGRYYDWTGDMPTLLHNAINYVETGGDALPWLVENPKSGTVAGHSSGTSTITFDATHTQPGSYTGVMKVKGNDPNHPTINVPVTLQVQVNPNYGRVVGHVSSDHPGGAFAGAKVCLVDYSCVTSDSTGGYSIYAPPGAYQLTASANGYLDASANVTVVARTITTQNLQLLRNQPIMAVSPTNVSLTIPQGQTGSQNVAIANMGAGSLNWQSSIDVPWASADPSGGTIAGYGNQAVAVTLDATQPQYQPGDYAGTLTITGNDPDHPSQDVSLNMHVAVNPTYGHVAGLVTTDRPGGPLSDAQVCLVNYLCVSTDTNGAYSIYAPAGTYQITATSGGYLDGSDNVLLSSGDLTVQNFELLLNQPIMSVSPASLEASVTEGQTTQAMLTISNDGAGTLNYRVQEIAVMGPQNPATRQLDIPAGVPAPANTAAGQAKIAPRPASHVTVHPSANRPADLLNVLLVDADGDNYGYSPIQNILLAYGDMNVSLWNAQSSTPTLADLQAYDVVVTWTDYQYADPVAMGNVLADYVDAGGKVIDMMFAVGVSPWSIQGRYHDEGYTAIDGGYPAYSWSCLGAYDASDPIMDGVTQFCDWYRAGGTYLTANSTAVAYYEDGELLVAKKNDIPVVTISSYPGINYNWTGDMPNLLHNSILYVSGGGNPVSWMDESPRSGSIPGYGSATVTVTFDATALLPGDYTAVIKVSGNDPSNPSTNVPVLLHVVPGGQPGHKPGQ